MRRILLLLAVVAPSWGATPTVVQKTVATANATAVSTGSITTHTGNAVVVLCGNSATGATITASDGTNTYTGVATGMSSQASEGAARAFVAKNITGVTHAITCTATSGNPFTNIFVYEVAGASVTAPVDVPTTAQAGGAGGTSAAPSFTLPATTFANDLLVFMTECANTCAAGAGVDAGNSQSDGQGDESETYSKSATGTYTGAFTQSSGIFLCVGVAVTDGGAAAPISGFSKAKKLEKLNDPQ